MSSETHTPSGLPVYAAVVSGKKKKKIPELDFINQLTFKSTEEKWVPKESY